MSKMVKNKPSDEEQQIVDQLDFDVVYVSGKKVHEPGDALRTTKNLFEGKGWISEGHCHYPQKMILKFPTKCILKKIQVLVHHEFIPKKVIFSTCDEIPEAKEDFDLLGAAEFRDNKETNFEARELKTIFLDTVSLYLKMTVHKCHLNSKNTLNQAGIMAIEISGVPIGEKIHQREHLEHRNLITRDKDRRISNVSLKQRMDTAQARHLLERNYAQELSKVQTILKKKLDRAKSEDDTEKLQDAYDDLEDVRTSAMLLLKEERNAIGHSDEQFAEACEKEIRSKCASAYTESGIYEILSKDELKESGLDKLKSQNAGRSQSRDSHRAKTSSSSSARPKSRSSSSHQERDKKRDRSHSKSSRKKD